MVKATLSSWVRRLIKDAYVDAALPDAAQTSTRVHELRGIAASLTVQATFSIESILSAASWASSSTFTKFYLRDISGLQGDLMVLGPIVAGARVIR